MRYAPSMVSEFVTGLTSHLVVFCIGGAFQGGATSLSHIFIGRGIGGIGVGALRRVCNGVGH